MKRLKVQIFVLLAVFTIQSAFSAGREIYPAPAQAAADLSAALKSARETHKRIILDFGGNWCSDCHVLDIYIHDATNLSILQSNYLLVHINIGYHDQNEAIANRYQVVITKGVPVLVVLDEHGKLLFSQKTGVFEAVHGVQSSSVTDFLVHWKPTKPGCSPVQLTC